MVENKNVNEPVDEELKKVVLETPNKVIAKMEELRVADAMTEIFGLFKRCNKYIDETMPWALAKDEAKKRASGNGSLQSGRVHQRWSNPSGILHAGNFR